ncbi:MAG: hypothetical protein ABSH47_11565 [Bryobacteraceae bacterium]|jgi:hypothetical protein
MKYWPQTRRTLGIGFGFIVAFGLFAPALQSEEPPADLTRRVAAKETEDEKARNHYTWRQTVVVQELDARGLETGRYREVRDIFFSLDGKRTEQLAGKRSSTLTRLALTEEDFRDLRDIQPLLLTTDRLFLYESRFKGEETVDGVDCWVLAVRPRQILAGQRLFDGMIWVDKTDNAIVKSQGQAVPQERGGKHENLFPHFTTTRRKVDGHGFPASTLGDDTLWFRGGPQRERLSVRYEDYKRFSAASTIHFEQ